MPITWLDKIDGFDLGNPQKNVNAADMNQIKTTVNTTETSLSTHSGLTNNPHGVTKAQVGLSNVENISINGAITAAIDALIGGAPGALDTLNELAAALGDDASFSTAVTNALALKAPIASPTFTGTVSGITKSMVGLGNVDNTSDATKLAAVFAKFVFKETPTGTIDGVNDDFTIAFSAVTVIGVYVDGTVINSANYTVVGTALTITNALVIPTNSLQIDYIK